MAFESPVHMFTFDAGSDLTSSQYRFVSVAADGEVDETAAAALADGVVQNNPNTGEEASVMMLPSGGISKVEASAAISVGDDVGVAANGKARTATTGDEIVGLALTAAGADEEILSVLLGRRGTA